MMMMFESLPIHPSSSYSLMRNFFYSFSLICAFFVASSLHTAPGLAEEPEYDIVIYGCTSAGIAAAVQAKRMDKTVIVVGPDEHLGGLTAGGLGWTDSGNKAVVGGISREYYQRIKKVYDQEETWKWQKPSAYSRYREGDDAQWTFEPGIAEQVFEDLVKEYDVSVLRDEWLDRKTGVNKDGNRIAAITMLSGKTFKGKVFIDATYEGDLMATAGVSYTTGREANSQYGETLNGVQTRNARSHQFSRPIDPYVIPGKPESGLLPRIHAEGPGEEGSADKRLQAYCFRVCLTKNPENRVSFPKPENYDPKQYELLLRDLLAGSRHINGKMDMLPNLKTDTNNHGSFSTDNIGMNYDYPDATYERRKEIIEEHRSYQQGYFYFLGNDPRVPEDVRRTFNQWGLAKDEFLDNGHWPHQIYVREARRMVGDFVVTENHLRRKIPTPRSVGMGSYNMDSHNVQRYVDKNGHARNEGDVQVNPGGPYPIDYGAIIPKKSECANLLVPVCVSSTHIAFGSIRMEPVFMVLGQSAATAAGIAIDQEIAVQDVDYEDLKTKLEDDKQVLEFVAGRGGSSAAIDIAKLPGVIVDDADAELSGAWTVSFSQGPFANKGYQHEGAAGDGKSLAVFRTKLPKAGKYAVNILYSPYSNRATNVPVTIKHVAGETKEIVNQQKKPNSETGFHTIGTYEFGSNEPAVVTISNADTDGHVIIDAVQFLPAK
jgi:hypothetical protein